MVNEFELIFDKLKDSKVSVIDLLGCYGMLILSKSIFKKNKEITNFINNIFEIELPLYVTKSRTLMIAKILRVIYADKDDRNKLDSIVKDTISKLEEINKTEEIAKNSNNKKQHNENDKLEKWLKGL